MKKIYTVCVAYHVTYHTEVLVEAESIDEACQKAIDEEILDEDTGKPYPPDELPGHWDRSKAFDDCGPTFVCAVKEVDHKDGEAMPDPYDALFMFPQGDDDPWGNVPEKYTERVAGV